MDYYLLVLTIEEMAEAAGGLCMEDSYMLLSDDLL